MSFAVRAQSLALRALSQPPEKKSLCAGVMQVRSVIMMFRHLERWLSGRKRQIANLLYES